MKTSDDRVAEIRDSLAAYTRMAYARGLSSGVSGNPSARLPDDPDRVLIKATGCCFGEATPGDFVLVDLDGNPVGGSGKPSKEVHFHCGIYRLRPEVGAVFHGHSAYTTAYVAAKGDLPLITAASRAFIGKTAVVEFAPAGSGELAKMVVDSYADPDLKCCILKTHGFVTVGPDIARAYYMADVLEDNAKVASIMASYK